LLHRPPTSPSICNPFWRLPGEYDRDIVDEVVLALMYLTLHDGGHAWKSHDWNSLDRLHEKGFIGNPVSKATVSIRFCLDSARHFCSIPDALLGGGGVAGSVGGG